MCCQRMSEVKEHHKMYKKGKVWIVAMVSLGSGTLLMSQMDTIQAATQSEINNSSMILQQETQSSTVVSKIDSSNQEASEKKATANNSSLKNNEDATSKSSESENQSVSKSSAAQVSSEVSDNASRSETDESNQGQKSTGSEEEISVVKAASSSEESKATSSAVTQSEDISTASSEKEKTATPSSSNEIKQDTNNSSFTDDKSNNVVADTATETNNIQKVSSRDLEKKSYSEQYRNQIHYSPDKNWMNDPNGLFYDDKTGIYHLYYQYNPEGNEWGNMSWGHATSKDMINWKQEQLAIPMLTDQGWEDFTYTNTTGNLAEAGEVRYVGVPTTNWGDSNGKKAIFSGSVYVDKNNVSGLGVGTVLAFYTADYQIATRINDGKEDGWGTWLGLNEIQEQHLAYSQDGGKTFIQYSPDKNAAVPKPLIPVTDSKGGDAANFRDPNVVYDDLNKQFLLTVVSNQQALIYSSKDLLHWKYASSIQREKNVGLGVWECPTLIPMTVAGTKTTKWIFAVSVQQGAHATGSGMEYYVGDITAAGQWVPESTHTMKEPLTFDYGEDFYAGIPFANMKDKRNVLIAWQSNWSYTGEAKTSPWYGHMTLPRELKLVKDIRATDGYLLRNTVVSEIAHNEQENVLSSAEFNTTLKNSEHLLNYTGTQYKVTADFSWDTKNPPESVGFKLRVSHDGRYYLRVGYDLQTKEFFVQRLNTGEPGMGNPRDKMNAFVDPGEGKITLTIYVDETSIEAFANDGERAITQNFFMRPEYVGVQPTNQLYLYAQNGEVHVTGLKINPLTSIWKNESKVTFNYLDDKGNKIVSSKQKIGKIGDSYSMLAPVKIDNYFLSSTNMKNKNADNLYTAQNQVINYIYRKVQTNLWVKDSTLTVGTQNGWKAENNFIGGNDAAGKELTIKDVAVLGTVNPSKPGIYTVKYSYTDVQGNTILKTIKVTVVDPIKNKETRTKKSRSEQKLVIEANKRNNSRNNQTTKNGLSKQQISNKKVDYSMVNADSKGFKAAKKVSTLPRLDIQTGESKKNQKHLPQTGESNISALNILGIILTSLSSIGLFLRIKRKRDSK